MTYYIRQMRVAITFLLITSIGYAYGDYEDFGGCEDSQNCLSCQPACCGKGFFSADLLYWRAFESGLGDCVPSEVVDIVTSEGQVISTFRGKGRDPHFKWDPGFRVAAGYELACSVDIAAVWTHFHSNFKGSRFHTNEESFHHIGNRAHWNIHLDVLDVIGGYNFNLGSCFALTPFGGLRCAKIDQKVHLGDFPHSSMSSIDDNLSRSGLYNKQNFWGIGPLFGVEADWKIGCGLSLYANGSISWLYGKFDVKLTEFDETFYTENFCRVNNHLDAILACADAGLGIRWQTCFCRNKQLIVQLGLEHHRYFDYNRIGGYGDLSFDGINLSLGFEF